MARKGQKEKKRGAFIVLEGLDRSGKTTQVKLLQARLVEAGDEVCVMRFPGGFFLPFPLLCVRFVEQRRRWQRWWWKVLQRRDDKG